MATNKRVFTLRLKDGIFDKIAYLADQQHRSVTNLVEFIILQWLASYEADNGPIVIKEDSGFDY